ncbi:GTP pyrophosphokinase [Algoriphagus winogradskyi]|uniref:PpGpp synthetase catalytic domain-containing protein (RelA/SpoT-type nucleotidyltranferase) n=1 Tax=Algoriphagus winogradskyi TaxID=237017 RepID=A0ABY1PA75_9BACT|nr:hypothetical protein [Algoriphagus winogradskyi]SMP29796.1 ppGpp synthetase catalytic domain-containing protein (RelA/SpoT-type nucleotidyltranferase) [Algoriphagus winogradskyi]
MKKKSATILKDYDSEKFLLEEFGEVIHTLTKSLIGKELNPHQINFRVKNKDSLSNKLLRKSNKYTSIKDITDIVGLRIITYFEDDIDKVAEILKKEFEIDYPNSVDKRQVEADKFGYRSLHYVASLNKERLALTEYKKFKTLKFEVQIRSILQHSWAEIEHDLGYKGESEIPESAKRTFYRVAALLEQADIEFSKLRKEISEHELLIKQQITTPSSTIKIDKSAIIAFIKESKTLISIEHLFESVICKRGTSSDSSVVPDAVLPYLQKMKIVSVKQLDDLLAENKDELINYANKEFQSRADPKPKTFIPGAALYWLMSMLDDRTIPSNKGTANKKPQIQKPK